MLAVAERETFGKKPYRVVEEVHIFHFEHTEFKVPLIHLREDKQAAGHVTQAIANTSIAFNVHNVFFDGGEIYQLKWVLGNL